MRIGTLPLVAGFDGKALIPCATNSLTYGSSLKCPVAAHWNCIAGTQRDEILKAAREKDRRDCETSGGDPDQIAKRRALAVEETTEFICGNDLRD